MRKLIFFAVAGYLWRKLVRKGPAATGRLRPFRR
jgi:hypothetical protein